MDFFLHSPRLFSSAVMSRENRDGSGGDREPRCQECESQQAQVRHDAALLKLFLSCCCPAVNNVYNDQTYYPMIYIHLSVVVTV